MFGRGRSFERDVRGWGGRREGEKERERERERERESVSEGERGKRESTHKPLCGYTESTLDLDMKRKQPARRKP